MSSDSVRHYRGRSLRKVAWGLWKVEGETRLYLLDYYPQGRNGDRVRRWVKTNPALKLSEIKAFLDGVKADRAKVKMGMARLITYISPQEAAEQYLKDLTRRDMSASYLRDVQRSLARFVDFIPCRFLHEISLNDVTEFLEEVKAGGAHPTKKIKTQASARTVNKYQQALSTWLDWCRRRGYTTENPADRIDKAKQHRKMIRYPSPEEMVQIVRALDNRYDAALVSLLAFTGLRMGSFLSLSSDCFEDTGIFVPHTKRGTEWRIRYDDDCPLWGPTLSEIGLWAWALRTPTRRALANHFKAACANLGISYTLHDLRHAFGSWQAMIGEDMKDISARLHHTNTQTTEKYYAQERPRGKTKMRENTKRVGTMWTLCTAIALGKKQGLVITPVVV